ncbi:hypothetical protein D3C72_2596070 [compost metagenome]
MLAKWLVGTSLVWPSIIVIMVRVVEPSVNLKTLIVRLLTCWRHYGTYRVGPMYQERDFWASVLLEQQ